MRSNKITMIIHTPSNEDYIKVVSVLISQGIRWYANDSSVHSNFWNMSKNGTCVVVREGVKKLTYCDIEYIKYENLEFIEAEQFLRTDKYNLKNIYDLK